MSAIEKFFTNLKRLFEPRTQEPVTKDLETLTYEPVTRDVETPAADAAAPSAPVPTAAAPSPVEEPEEVAPTAVEEPLEAAVIDVTPPSEPEPALAEPIEAEPEIPLVASEPEVPTPAAHALATEPLGVPEAVAEGALVLQLETERVPAPTFEVTKSGATLGRGQENTIRLEDLSVSRRHARITYRQGGFWLSDLGSMGGTWIDGTKLNAPKRVATGQLIDIGIHRLRVAIAGEAHEAKSKAARSSETVGEGRRRR